MSQKRLALNDEGENELLFCARRINRKDINGSFFTEKQILII